MFGRPLAEILTHHPELKFFFHWLKAIKFHQIPDDFEDDTNLGKYQEYIELKKGMNINPSQSLSHVNDQRVYRLLKDFLMELPQPFLQEAADTILTIISFACKFVVLYQKYTQFINENSFNFR